MYGTTHQHPSHARSTLLVSLHLDLLPLTCYPHCRIAQSCILSCKYSYIPYPIIRCCKIKIKGSINIIILLYRTTPYRINTACHPCQIVYAILDTSKMMPELLRCKIWMERPFHYTYRFTSSPQRCILLMYTPTLFWRYLRINNSFCTRSHVNFPISYTPLETCYNKPLISYFASISFHTVPCRWPHSELCVGRVTGSTAVYFLIWNWFHSHPPP